VSTNEVTAEIDMLRTVRAPDGEVLSGLPEALVRANKVMGFDSTGNPVGVIPITGSGTELAIDLINSTESGKGAALVGFNARNLAQKLLDILDVRDFGATGVADDTLAINAAISYAVARGIKWIRLADSTTYTVGALVGASNVNFVGNKARLSNGYFRVYDVDAYGKLKLPTVITSFWSNAVYMNADGSGATDYDARAAKPIGKRYYVRHTGGASSNDGLTFSTALNCIQAALSKPDVVEIVLQPGDYPSVNNAVGEVVLPRNISMTVLGGGAANIYGCLFNLPWAPDSVYPTVYSAPISGTTSGRFAWDSKYKDRNGDFMQYQVLPSVAAVAETPGSAYFSAGTVYVMTIDGRLPDADIRIFEDSMFRVTGPFTFYTEGINFIGVSNVLTCAMAENMTPLWIAVDCSFGYSEGLGGSGGGSFRTEGGNSILLRCTGYKSRRDGFNYHQWNAILQNCGWHVEIDCVGRDNGATGEGNNQGSSLHDGGKILRINGYYARNEGPNLEDVNINTVSYNVGCLLEDSLKTSVPRHVQSAQGATMYCVGVKMRGRADLDAVVADGGKVIHYKCAFTRLAGKTYDHEQFNPVCR
jgi:hypothetical protein